jgi:hypothetical protein
MSPGEALMELNRIGFRFRLQGEVVKVRFEGKDTPDLSQVAPLLALVKEHKAEVINYLAQKQERVLTCYECGHFRPAVNSPNPTQAWGHCRKRERGRYGAAMACEAIMIAPEAPEEAIPHER